MKADDTSDAQPARTWPGNRPEMPSDHRNTDDLGAGLAEYALLLLLIALACIGALMTISPPLQAMFNATTALF